jgi:integrase
MKRKHDTREVPANAKRRVKDGKAQALITVFGKDTWCDLTPSGRAKAMRPEWYANLRMADGTTKLVKLCRDKTAAELMLAKLRTREERISVGIDIRPATTSEKFPQLVERYWSEKARSGCTDVYLQEARARLASALSGLGVDSLDKVKKLTDNRVGAWLDGSPLSNGSKIQRVIQLKSFFKWLLANHLIPRLPTFPKISDKTKHIRRPLTRAEVDLLEANSPWPRGLFYALAFSTLARKGAMLKLLPQDIHIDGENAWMLLRLQNSKTKTNHQVPIPKRLIPPLQKLIKECPKGVPLFHSMHGLINHHSFRRDLKAAGIPRDNERGRAVTHSLRHGGTTELLEKGVSVLLVQRMGGWRSLRVLAKHYAHLSPIRSRKEIDNVFE